MNTAIKWVVALLVAALIVVIGLIVLTTGNDSDKAIEATTAPVVTAQPEATAAPEAAAETAEEPTEDMEDQSGAQEAQSEDAAQGTMYEGALAGLTEEEIAAMALAEEQSAARNETDSGVEGAVD